jgi:GR25 family glycosyltransferase involved in LPS biosynthesis|tara:strand:+ start:117 stop:797 length:681 start_codon:yes stop_codon:yes gene_type:complete
MIYIIHYKKLKERKDYLIKELTNLNFEYYFIEDYDRNNMTEHILSYYNGNKDLWSERTKNIYTHKPIFRALNNGEICNAVSHLEAINNISNSSKEYGCVIEDDIIFKSNFNKNYSTLLKDIPPHYDIIFVGNSFNMMNLSKMANFKVDPIKNNIYNIKPGRARTVDFYLIKKDFAKKLYDNIKTIVLPFDFELNYWLGKLNANCYWVDPGLVEQGSMNGTYKSSNR